MLKIIQPDTKKMMHIPFSSS